MFFWGKKQINEEQIKNFNDGIYAIKTYIFTWEWDKAYKAISEIRSKEKKGLEELLQKIDDTYMREKLQKDYQKNETLVQYYEQKLKQKEQKDKERISKETFKLKFKKIREEIDLLGKTNKHHEALTLLWSFLEDNKENFIVIDFYNKEKKQILKNIEYARKLEEKKSKLSTHNEALKLIWETLKWDEEKEAVKKQLEWDKKPNFLEDLKKKVLDYLSIWERLKKKKLIDEVTFLIESENQVNLEIAKNKLEKMHQWLVKELTVNNITGYEFFGKILWADKISGDTFGFNEDKLKYNLFLWDATGHWVRAWLIVSLLSRLFTKFAVGNTIEKIVLEVNNGLKQDLQSRNFITWIFFEIDKWSTGKLKFVWMGHEPMLLFRSSKWEVERLIPGWLAAWIRLIKDITGIKVREVNLENDDILLCFSDGMIEAKDTAWNFMWLDRLQSAFEHIAKREKNIANIYNYIIEELKIFRGGSKFDDDATVVMLKRNTSKDIVKQNDNFLQEVAQKEWLGRMAMRKMIWKSKEEVQAELEKIRKEKELTNIVRNLENLYYTWEILKLKQEAIRFIKQGYIHKDINKYLKKAIANENSYKISQKEKKVENKYSVLKELLKKWDYATVIREASEIIAKEWNV